MSRNSLTTKYDLEIELLSPLHIGNGNSLVHDYDFAYERNMVYMIDQDKLIEQVGDAVFEKGFDARISRLLPAGPYEPVSRYGLGWHERPRTSILEFEKDVFGRPYIPGSSLKGALRTGIVSGVLNSNEISPLPAILGDPRVRAKTAGSAMERGALSPGTTDSRRSPNYDLMRSLRVTDSQPVLTENIELSAVDVFSLKQGGNLEPKPGMRILVESLPAGTRVTGACQIDEYIFGPQAEKLDLDDAKDMMHSLPERLRRFSDHLLEGERDFYAKHGPVPLSQFYAKLLHVRAGLASNQFLMQMSWGTGWRSKTVSPEIEGSADFAAVVGRFSLDKGRNAGVFPKTRKLVVDGEIPCMPLGWVRVTMKEVS